MAALFLLPLSAHAVTKKIEIEGSAPPREREIKPPRNTTVITKKGAPASSAAPVPGDICPSLEGAYYCASVGREAWLRVDYPTALDEDGPTTSVLLGRVLGVAWRSIGQPVGVYLEEKPDFSLPLSSYLRKNIPSPRATFYFIIDRGSESPMLVETHRIIVKE